MWKYVRGIANMPIELPNLDDRQYNDLVEEMRALIPRYAPDWTDHNASDPGIMLIELLAWLTEATLYRLNRVPETTEWRFLELLDSPAYRGQAQDALGKSQLERKRILDEALTAAARKIHTRWRAVTASDYEEIVLREYEEIAQHGKDLKLGVARVKCLPEMDVTAHDPYAARAGHVSLIVLEKDDHANGGQRTNEDEIKRLHRAVARLLDERRLITTRLHVASPKYVRIKIDAVVSHAPQATASRLQVELEKRLTSFFDPGKRGMRGSGWTFGRPVYKSEIHGIIEDTVGVDHVKMLDVQPVPEREDNQSAVEGELARIEVPPDGLVQFDYESSKITLHVVRETN